MRLRYKSGLAAMVLSGLFALSGFTSIVPYQQQSKAVYSDTFESYVTSKLVKQAYTPWEGGASLDVSLEEKITGDGGKAMRVDVLGPNLSDQVTSGSLYHSLPLTQRNWANSIGIKFWVKNDSEKILWLTFNFKEAYNEYWSVSNGAPFLLSSNDTNYQQEECQYGNLEIPPEFTGAIIIPFSSFSVPDWNTARGNKKLELSSIESFALGTTLRNDYPRTFYIDSIEVLSKDTVVPLLKGVRHIEIPPSGVHLEHFKLVSEALQGVIEPRWIVKAGDADGVSINSKGELAIPATAKSGKINVEATFSLDGKQYSIDMPVKLTGGLFQTLPDLNVNTENETVPVPTPSAYDRFSMEFEKWAMDYRPVFVVLSVGMVVFFIFLLSQFQRKLK